MGLDHLHRLLLADGEPQTLGDLRAARPVDAARGELGVRARVELVEDPRLPRGENARPDRAHVRPREQVEHLQALGVTGGRRQIGDRLRIVDVATLLEKRRASGRAIGSGGPAKITLDNQLSDDYTVLEVKCPDRLGLLYLITKTLATLGLDIATARIATEIDQAVDTFYVHDGRGRKIEDPAALARVREALEQALMQPI